MRPETSLLVSRLNDKELDLIGEHSTSILLAVNFVGALKKNGVFDFHPSFSLVRGGGEETNEAIKS